MDKISKKTQMIKKRLDELKKKFILLGIDGYVVPKNDEFFSEYSQKNRLKTISNFSGSAGYAIILKLRIKGNVAIRRTVFTRKENRSSFRTNRAMSSPTM